MNKTKKMSEKSGYIGLERSLCRSNSFFQWTTWKVYKDGDRYRAECRELHLEIKDIRLENLTDEIYAILESLEAEMLDSGIIRETRSFSVLPWLNKLGDLKEPINKLSQNGQAQNRPGTKTDDGTR